MMTESRLKTVITSTKFDVKKFDLDTLYILDLDLVLKDIRPDDTREGD